MKKLGFGLMRLPTDESGIDISQTCDLVDKFISLGFTYFDTAAPYHGGASEKAFKTAVADRYPRDAYTVTDKLSLFMIEKPEDMQTFFDKQLEKLGVDYIDIYLIHSLSARSYKKAQEFGAFEFAAEMKRQGKVKQVGFSFHDTADVLDTILTDHPEVEYVQLQINYLDWEDNAIQSRLCYETAMKHNKPVIVMEPVKGGALVDISRDAQAIMKKHSPDLSIASWAIRFAASLENVVMVLSGMSNEQQVNDNLSYMKDFVPFTEEEFKIALQCGEIVRNDITIPCTACRYCVDDCPMNIAIPEYFRLFNDINRFGIPKSAALKNSYNDISSTRGKACDCIKCGMCESLCPQKIEITSLLEKVSSVFDKR